MTIMGISCAQNSVVSFKGNKTEKGEKSGIMPQTNPIDQADKNFEVASKALSDATKALINMKKSEGKKSQVLSREDVEAKFVSMKNSDPISYVDLEDMGYTIDDFGTLQSNSSAQHLDPSIFNGKETCVIYKKGRTSPTGTLEQYNEYDKSGNPIASIKKYTSDADVDGLTPAYTAKFFNDEGVVSYSDNYWGERRHTRM